MSGPEVLLVSSPAGIVDSRHRIRRQNHWFDALYNACAAAHGCGVRLVQEILPPAPPPAPRDPDNFVSEEWLDRARLEGWMHNWRKW